MRRLIMANTTIQDIFNKFLPSYSECHLFSDEQYKTSTCIMKCRTAEMGAHVSECENCHNTYIHYNSCKNRHCPMCQGMEVDEWIDRCQEDVIDSPYFHAVFTIPSELYPLVYANQKLLYDALYHAVNLTLSELSSDKKHLGARIGYICVLHTWGSKLNYHPHLHTIVLGGGLDDKNHWKDKGGKFLFPIKVMSAVFKKHYLNELKNLFNNNFLIFSESSATFKNHYSFKELLNTLYDKEWIVYTKEAFNGAKSVIKYLGNYTHRSAISNKRILRIDNEQVSFLAKDYSIDGKYRPTSLSGEEFIRRFLMHVLPKGFVRIRYYGLLSCRTKKEQMTLCRNLLGCEKYISKLREKSVTEKILILYNKDISKCKCCGEPLHQFRVDGRYMLC